MPGKITLSLLLALLTTALILPAQTPWMTVNFFG